MPKQKDLKRLVRARMKKTGESYTAARAVLVGRQAQKERGAAPRPAAPAARAATKAVKPPELAVVAGMKDAAVVEKTGKTWAQWAAALDGIDATRLEHAEIARRLHEEFDVPHWWSQMITVGYERIRGLRARGQRREGGWEVSKSKTIGVPIAELYAAFEEAGRKRWLRAKVVERKATPRKSMRFQWEDGTPFECNFWSKGAAKSQVQLQHRQLVSKAAADEMRAFWSERLEALAAFLAPKP